MKDIPEELLVIARRMDLYTYLSIYEPHELVHVGGREYCTREHDSLKISNGLWCWHSRDEGGASALDYLTIDEILITDEDDQGDGEVILKSSDINVINAQW